MKEAALSWTLKIMHIFSEVSGQFYMHSANYKERKENGRTTHKKGWEEGMCVIILPAKTHGMLLSGNKK